MRKTLNNRVFEIVFKTFEILFIILVILYLSIVIITKVTSNEEHIDICKRFYVDKESNLKIALHCNYSEINIKKIKQNINKKIKELYK